MMCGTHSCFGFDAPQLKTDFLKKKSMQLLLWSTRKDGDNPVNQSKLEVITRSRHKTRENVHARGFGFTSDWLKK